MAVVVFNGWAAGPETWSLCEFERDWVFDYVEQMDGLPERVLPDLGDLTLVGFSMGGSTALRMLIRFRERVKKLVLVSATPCMLEHKEDGWAGMSLRRMEALRLGTRLVFGGDPSPMYDIANMDRGLEYLVKTDLRAELLAASRRGDYDRLPVRIFQSERDGIVRPANAEFLRAVFPLAEVTYVPGSEHVLPVTQPELIDDAIGGVGGRCDRGIGVLPTH